ncbi:hypothetical protein ACFLQL_00230 [Verrucomicrobiota bacterium]
MPVAAANSGGSTIFSTNGNYNRGCAMRIAYDTQGGLGCQLVGTSSLPSSQSDPFIISGFSFNKEEGIGVNKCFKDMNFVYTFGDSLEQSILTVKIVGMMSNDSTVLSTLQKFYTANRISATDKTLTLNYGSTASSLQGYLLGISSSTLSADYLLQTFDLKILMTGFFGGAGGSSDDLVPDSLGGAGFSEGSDSGVGFSEGTNSGVGFN